jgi:hypothetical protein
MIQVATDGPAMPCAYTQAQFVQKMNIGRTTFFREIQAGRLKCFKIGRRWYVSHESAADWLRSKESEFVYTQ